MPGKRYLLVRAYWSTTVWEGCGHHVSVLILLSANWLKRDACLFVQAGMPTWSEGCKASHYAPNPHGGGSDCGDPLYFSYWPCACLAYAARWVWCRHATHINRGVARLRYTLRLGHVMPSLNPVMYNAPLLA